MLSDPEQFRETLEWLSQSHDRQSLHGHHGFQACGFHALGIAKLLGSFFGVLVAATENGRSCELLDWKMRGIMTLKQGT